MSLEKACMDPSSVKLFSNIVSQIGGEEGNGYWEYNLPLVF